MVAWLFVGILICCVFLSFAIGFNYGIDKSGELKKFNDENMKRLRGILK